MVLWVRSCKLADWPCLGTKAEAVYSGQPGLHWSPAVTHKPMYAKFIEGVLPVGSPCFLVGDRMGMTLSRQARDSWSLCRVRICDRERREALEGRGGNITRCLKFLMEGRVRVLEETEGREGSMNSRRASIFSHHVQVLQNQDPGA